jgi:HEAT repeats
MSLTPVNDKQGLPTNLTPTVSRFVSTFAGAFRAFFIYKHDSKALDEILKNVCLRFREIAAVLPVLRLEITNRSLVYGNEAVGYPEITAILAGTLRKLEIKAICLKSTMQSAQFFQVLSILSSKDAHEAKQEKLLPFMGDDELKPFTLIPFTTNSLLLRLSDDSLINQLSVLRKGVDNKKSFYDDLTSADIGTIPDLFTWIGVRSESLEESSKNLTKNLTDAAREGYMSWERFLRVFPLPPSLLEKFKNYSAKPTTRKRKQTVFGLAYNPTGRSLQGMGISSHAVSIFYDQEVKARQSVRTESEETRKNQDLELLELLLVNMDNSFVLGFRLLLRSLQDQNHPVIQGKILLLASKTWLRFKDRHKEENWAPLLGSLKESLCLTHNIQAALTPLMSATMDAEVFENGVNYFQSLEGTCIPPLLTLLDQESDRGARKKILFLLSSVSRNFGTESLIKMMSNASPYLLRNIVTIIGETRDANTIPMLKPLLSHDQKIVRIEAIRTLGKIGTTESCELLAHLIRSSKDLNEKKIAITFLGLVKDPASFAFLIAQAQDKSHSFDVRKEIYTAIATRGGIKAKTFLETIKKGSSLFGRFNPEQREEQALVDSLLLKIKI